MKLRYSVSFFIIMISVILTLSFAYYESYKRARYQLEYEQEMKHIKEETAPVDGKVQSEEPKYGYYLKNEQGYVVVYLFDQETVYEETSIKVEQLPRELQDEINQTKYIERTEDLYGFLENYSS